MLKGIFNYCPNAYQCMKGKSCAIKHICHVPRPEKKKEVGIYAEPGVGYYFDNGSDVKTAYSDNPLNFNMKLGLRYSIK